MTYASTNIQPETIASAYRDSGDLDTFTLSSNDVKVTCPSGEEKTTLQSERRKISISPIHYSWYNYGDPFEKSGYLGFKSGGIEGYNLFLVDGIVDRNGNYVVAQLILEKQHVEICINDTNMAQSFTVEMVAACNGSLLTGTSFKPIRGQFHQYQLSNRLYSIIEIRNTFFHHSKKEYVLPFSSILF